MIILESFGAGVIVLPRRAAEYAAQDGWLIVVGLTLFAFVCAALLTTAARRFAAQSFFSYTSRVLTRPVAYLLSAGLASKLLVNAAFQLRLFTLIIRRNMLPSTPAPVVGLMMAGICLYAAGKGMETRARVGEILFFACMLPLFVLLLLSLFDVDYTNLLPVLVTPPAPVINGTLRLGYVFAGLESVLLVFPFLNRPAEGRRAVTNAVLASGALLLLLTVLTIAKFGAEDLLTRPLPLLEMMDMLNLPGSFIERQDALVMSFWIITLFTGINAAVFYGAAVLRDMKHGSRHHAYAAVCAVVVYGLSCIPIDTTMIYSLMDRLYLSFGLFYLLVFPLVLLLVARVRGITGRTEAS